MHKITQPNGAPLIIDQEFTITGRGQVVTINFVKNGLSNSRESMKNWMNSIIDYKDKLWTVIGIETHLILEPRDAGLLIRPLNQEEQSKWEQ